MGSLNKNSNKKQLQRAMKSETGDRTHGCDQQNLTHLVLQVNHEMLVKKTTTKKKKKKKKCISVDYIRFPNHRSIVSGKEWIVLTGVPRNIMVKILAYRQLTSSQILDFNAFGLVSN